MDTGTDTCAESRLASRSGTESRTAEAGAPLENSIVASPFPGPGIRARGSVGLEGDVP